jgi:hypothetical protein
VTIPDEAAPLVRRILEVALAERRRLMPMFADWDRYASAPSRQTVNDRATEITQLEAILEGGEPARPPGVTP